MARRIYQVKKEKVIGLVGGKRTPVPRYRTKIIKPIDLKSVCQGLRRYLPEDIPNAYWIRWVLHQDINQPQTDDEILRQVMVICEELLRANLDVGFNEYTDTVPVYYECDIPVKGYNLFYWKFGGISWIADFNTKRILRMDSREYDKYYSRAKLLTHLVYLVCEDEAIVSIEECIRKKEADHLYETTGYTFEGYEVLDVKFKVVEMEAISDTKKRECLLSWYAAGSNPYIFTKMQTERLASWLFGKQEALYVLEEVKDFMSSKRPWVTISKSEAVAFEEQFNRYLQSIDGQNLLVRLMKSASQLLRK